MNSLLILGTGADQIFGIKKAKEMGLYTIGLDANAESCGVKLVDEFHQVSVKDLEAVEGFVRNYKGKIDGVIAFGVDIPEILAKVAEIRSLPFYTSFEKAALSKDKFLAKEILSKYGVRLPKYKKIETFEELRKAIKEFGYPVVLKPVDNSGARGVLRLTHKTDLKWTYEFSKSFCSKDYLIVEQFLDGLQISSESFVVDGRVYTIGLSARNYEFLEKFSPFIIENGGDLPPDLDDSQRELIDKEIKKCAEAFGVKNGVIKGDLVVKDGKIFVIEVALRLSGGHFSSVEIPMNTGVDFLKYAILIALGEKIDTKVLEYQSKRFVSLRYIFPYKKGIIRKLKFPDWMENDKNVVAKGFYFKEGDIANYPVKSHPERLGYFIVVADKREEIENKIDRVYKETVVEIE
ncbi:ATP-grasp domain-containing protein [Hippea alviniae]|uniref:ATP-grasp domain-containing protein n=1 Tax=Hippea alviniae TaxID=1279027 RepID=UPI0003B311A6|nr:ATP-grasp domain-containing protein [Hippea alviniae]